MQIDGQIPRGSISTGKPDESYILEIKKRENLPGIKE